MGWVGRIAIKIRIRHAVTDDELPLFETAK